MSTRETLDAGLAGTRRVVTYPGFRRSETMDADVRCGPRQVRAMALGGTQCQLGLGPASRARSDNVESRIPRDQRLDTPARARRPLIVVGERVPELITLCGPISDVTCDQLMRKQRSCTKPMIDRVAADADDDRS